MGEPISPPTWPKSWLDSEQKAYRPTGDGKGKYEKGEEIFELNQAVAREKISFFENNLKIYQGRLIKALTVQIWYRLEV
jgi:hypothetical protein